MILPTIVAILAPIVNSIQQFPQLYKTFITKSVEDLSLYSLLLILLTNLLWFLHGYIRFDVSLLFSGIISIFINTTLLLLYFFYKKSTPISI
jgi:uncharacterized protein with PQ loop repeat